MFLTSYYKYHSEYEKDAKRIIVRSYRPKVLKEHPYLSFEKYPDNFELFFDKTCELLMAINKIGDESEKTLFRYNNKHNLMYETTRNIAKDELISVAEYKYDNEDRIIQETYRTIEDNKEDEEISENTYSYSKNKTIIKRICGIEGDECEEYIIYNERRQVIEQKAILNNDEVIWWEKFEYDDSGKIIRELDIFENGESKEVHHDNSRESILTYNNKGHWIRETVMDDGEPIILRERIIEYFQ